MENRKYNLIADGYVCTTIEPETIRQRAGMFLKKSIRNVEERESILNSLLKWCKDAEINDFLIREEFTVIVKDRREKEYTG